jgi:hypothetical protein
VPPGRTAELDLQHPFRATGITLHQENGGDIESAARLAGHADTRTTQLYDETAECSACRRREGIEEPLLALLLAFVLADLANDASICSWPCPFARALA